MKISKKQMCVLKWVVKLFSVFVLLFGLFFYFGFGNPFSFSFKDWSKDMLLFGVFWLIGAPIMFIGQIVGLKWEKIGGFLIVIPISLFMVSSYAINQPFVNLLFFPLIIGCFYLYFGYEK